MKINFFCRRQRYKVYMQTLKQGKAEDIKKAIHYLEMILERDYNV
jgi:hypothetical protein